MPYQKGTGKSVVVALGGNALGNTPQEQYELVQDTAKHIVDMVAEGINVIVTHGMRPQVGMINNAFAYASAHDSKTPRCPSRAVGAMSQGYIGCHLSQAVLSEMKARHHALHGQRGDPDRGLSRRPAFGTPPSPWAFLTEEAKRKAEETGWTYKEDAGRGWRQVVASPKPPHRESDAIRDLFGAGYIVVSRAAACRCSSATTPTRRARRHRQGPLRRDDGRHVQGRHARDPHRRGQVAVNSAGRPGRHRRHGRRPGMRQYIEEGQFAPARCSPRWRRAWSTWSPARRAAP